MKFFIPVTDYYDGTKFFALKADGTPAATPLFVVLVAVEITDFVFAIDNVPVRHHQPALLHPCVSVCECARDSERKRERRLVGGRRRYAAEIACTWGLHASNRTLRKRAKEKEKGVVSVAG